MLQSNEPNIFAREILCGISFVRPLHNPHPVIARRLFAVAISLIMVTYEIASSAVASSQRQKQMLCKALFVGTGLKKKRAVRVTGERARVWDSIEPRGQW